MRNGANSKRFGVFAAASACQIKDYAQDLLDDLPQRPRLRIKKLLASGHTVQIMACRVYAVVWPLGQSVT